MPYLDVMWEIVRSRINGEGGCVLLSIGPSIRGSDIYFWTSHYNEKIYYSDIKLSVAGLELELKNSTNLDAILDIIFSDNVKAP